MPWRPRSWQFCLRLDAEGVDHFARTSGPLRAGRSSAAVPTGSQYGPGGRALRDGSERRRSKAQGRFQDYLIQAAGAIDYIRMFVRPAAKLPAGNFAWGDPSVLLVSYPHHCLRRNSVPMRRCPRRSSRVQSHSGPLSRPPEEQGCLADCDRRRRRSANAGHVLDRSAMIEALG